VVEFRVVSRWSSLAVLARSTVTIVVLACGCGVPNIQDVARLDAGPDLGRAGSAGSKATPAGAGGKSLAGVGGSAGKSALAGAPAKGSCASSADCVDPPFVHCDLSPGTGGVGGAGTAGTAGAARVAGSTMPVGVCVECLPEAPGARCEEGLYCSPDQRCTIGCQADADCNGLRCEASTHRCIGCQDSTAWCPRYTTCDTTTAPASCVPTCSEADANSCPGGWDCCGAACRNLQSDARHCGACYTSCTARNGTALCSAGTCTVDSCNPGFADCNLKAEDGCEIDTTSHADHCGGCAHPCSPTGATARCQNGVCGGMVCDAGLGDCNVDTSDGCETQLNTQVHCGACGRACQPAHASAYTCATGVCTITLCAIGWKDCNADPADGCEVNLQGEVVHCGDCNRLCTAANGTPACSAGDCMVASCNPGFYDCNRLVADGCEINLTNDTRNCGACNQDCLSGQHVTAAQCINGVCSVTGCDYGYADCSGGAADGCETDLNINVNHCRVCGNACPVPSGGTPSCVSGVCGISNCTAPMADCSATVAGCETDTHSSVNNCGGCGIACSYAHAAASCVAGFCALGTCAAGWGNCFGGSTDGCETQLNTLTHCAGCGLECSRPNATATCATGSCAISVCNSGFGNCNDIDEDGCETELNLLSHCGGCGLPCSLPQASASCSSGSCQIVACEDGYANCTGGDADGCETALGTVENCSGCGAACSYRDAAAVCTNGTCSMGACSPGFFDCNGSTTDGCEVDGRSDPARCGGCSTVCSSVHGTPGCSDSVCSIDCDPNWGDCDGLVSTGCEQTLLTNGNCGACNYTCPSGTPFCLAGTCTSHLDISLVGTPSTGSTANARTLAFNHGLATSRSVDNHRLVVVVIASRGNSLTAASPAASGVTYAGTAMTAASGTTWSGSSPTDVWSGIYLLRDASLPAGANTYQVSITTGSTTQYAQAIVAAAFELTGVDQTTSVDAGRVVGSSSQCSLSAPAASVTTTVEGDFVVDVVAYNESASTAAVAQSGQTKVLDAAPTGYTSFFGVSGYRNRVTLGTAAMNWSSLKPCSRHTHSVAAFRRASG
jgi:hypothetical protein